ncbi:MAG: hypothetical protein A2504_11405 [Bdellovibrionales bacterium RIFOXYD12_FULL_39_22]|nr:MAG: hypothetical protein A2385_09970 [Bdellovibrionales bacterium RIFOXYB1_FULL_39_21]OFZ44278.1 MAG: hypothetical protein A2485_07590 [Bdellovibrionales bacterium RIFOXYC12_FULL_39_17]OFZ46820.1 MAG: hypothetical protein A2404_04825 [Bdellovibrionales bacterium RIFOXYC1_FULL_39_130]OFZ75903.1 MAG: hypothetical protein A2560_02325 [Bdellovibrionales bacterium RIFOXYD1_FULL_39_84]OFZ95499.1 MAG: hypothetical protein A2504_11405 [Bdellovibrionales bacterium RIFOXYD12_FULL_39_22]HLE09762.1 hy
MYLLTVNIEAFVFVSLLIFIGCTPFVDLASKDLCSNGSSSLQSKCSDESTKTDTPTNEVNQSPDVNNGNIDNRIELAFRSQKAIEYGFDFMETFDDLLDWKPLDINGVHLNTIVHSHHPKRLNGANTLLNTMDYWSSSPAPHNFIMDHRERGGVIWDPKNIGSGKSLVMNVAGAQQVDGQNHGMTRFGATLSATGLDVEENAKAGYRSDAYVFFMVYHPQNYYPTCVARSGGKTKADCGGVESDCGGSSPCGYFNESELKSSGYDSFASTEKFISWGTAGVTPYTTFLTTHWGMDGEYPVEPYTGTSAIMYHGVHNNYPEFQFEGMHHLTEGRSGYTCANDYGKYDYPVNPYTGGHPPQNEWYGVEARLAPNVVVDESSVMELWWYEKDGTEHYLGSRNSGPWMSSCDLAAGLTVNRIFIGGNNSNTWKIGPRMKGEYYVDDFIINGTRIGPLYFQRKLEN